MSAPFRRRMPKHPKLPPDTPLLTFGLALLLGVPSPICSWCGETNVKIERPYTETKIPMGWTVNITVCPTCDSRPEKFQEAGDGEAA